MCVKLNTQSHLLQVYLGENKLSPKILSVKLLVIVTIVFKHYSSTYCL